MSAYRERIWETARHMLTAGVPVASALDFGCGDGWFSRRLKDDGIATTLAAVDVKRREQCYVEPTLYDGVRLPYADRSFDLVTTFDVIHHCPDPRLSLTEAARCCKRWLLIKDHRFQTPLERLALVVLDEIGNRRFGIPSPGLYQHGWEWSKVLEAQGFSLVKRVHPLRCHPGLIGACTNHLQYLDLWERAG